MHFLLKNEYWWIIKWKSDGNQSVLLIPYMQHCQFYWYGLWVIDNDHMLSSSGLVNYAIWQIYKNENTFTTGLLILPQKNRMTNKQATSKIVTTVYKFWNKYNKNWNRYYTFWKHYPTLHKLEQIWDNNNFIYDLIFIFQILRLPCYWE